MVNDCRELIRYQEPVSPVNASVRPNLQAGEPIHYNVLALAYLMDPHCSSILTYDICCPYLSMPIALNLHLRLRRFARNGEPIEVAISTCTLVVVPTAPSRTIPPSPFIRAHAQAHGVPILVPPSRQMYTPFPLSFSNLSSPFKTGVAARRRVGRQLEATDPALIDDWTLDHWDGVTPLQIYSGTEWPPFVLCPKGLLNPAGWNAGWGV
ncbi:hypothetical protein B0H19DRAFT_1065673 [Mycena capillaripes]|nr:hypothetical protein B0H19DRAFT_1065673 [Mycena capillaripes]